MNKTTKVYIKEFNYRGQQIRYWNKLIENKNIDFATMSITANVKYIIKYRYKF